MQTAEDAAIDKTDAQLAVEGGFLSADDKALLTNAGAAKTDAASQGSLLGSLGGAVGKAGPQAGILAGVLGALQLKQNPSSYISHTPSLSDIAHPSQWLTDFMHNDPLNPVESLAGMFGSSGSTGLPGLIERGLQNIHVVAEVNIDGKKVTKAVTKVTKKTAGLSR